jgi:heat-inducible transcriptional repressor
MADERRLAVLRAIVEDYVATHEPVGSRSLAERHRLGVSPATIRNDMAALEEAGYITQPHTSAGRIPTDAGYRLFVDELSSVRPLSGAERRAISTLLEGAVDLDDIVDRTVRALTSLTHQVALVQYPSLRSATLRHIELLALENGRLLTVIITENGRVEQRIVTPPSELDPSTVARFRGLLNEVAAGAQVGDLAGALGGLLAQFPQADRPALAAIGEAITEAMTAGQEDRVVLAGTANLTGVDIDFPGSIRPVLEAIEEQVVMLKLLSEMAQEAGPVAVRIGHENPHSGLAQTSMVATSYGTGGEGLASLAVLGPTRMDYPGSIAAVRAVARYLSRILAT